MRWCVRASYVREDGGGVSRPSSSVHPGSQSSSLVKDT